MMLVFSPEARASGRGLAEVCGEELGWSSGERSSVERSSEERSSGLGGEGGPQETQPSAHSAAQIPGPLSLPALPLPMQLFGPDRFDIQTPAAAPCPSGSRSWEGKWWRGPLPFGAPTGPWSIASHTNPTVNRERLVNLISDRERSETSLSD